MGDFIDGYLSTGTPRNPNQVLSPKEQRLAAMSALSAVEPFLIIEGDHDLWHSKQELQHDWLFEFAHREGYNYAQWGSELEIHASNAERPLKFLVRHRYKGSRATDALKPQKNLHLEHGPADLVALAHVHSNPGCYKAHPKRRREEKYIAVQSGTYKLRDDYGKKLGFTGADYGVPAVIVMPNGQIKTFDHYEDGIEALV